MENSVLSYLLKEGWAWSVIDDIIGDGGLFVDGDWIESKDQKHDGDVRLVQLADIGDGYFRDKSNRFMTYDKAINLNCTFLKNGDILIARMPEPLGRACIFPFNENDKFVTVVDIAVVRTGETGISNKCIMHFVNSPSLRKIIESLKTGTTRKRISRGNLGKIKLPIPPLAEQYRIVAKIEELLSELEHAEQTLKKAKKRLEVYRQAFLKKAFEGKITTEWRKRNYPELASEIVTQIKKNRQTYYLNQLEEWQHRIAEWSEAAKVGVKPKKPIVASNTAAFTKSEISTLSNLPAEWDWVKIGNVDTLISSGSTPKGGRNIYLMNGVPFIRSQNVYPGKLLVEDLVFISEEINTKMSRTQVEQNDVLLNITGASIGRCAYIPDNFGRGNVNQHVCIIRTLKEVSYKYLCYFLNSAVAQLHINKINSGATREALTLDQIKNFPFPLCSLDEQNQIVLDIEYQFTIIDNLDQTISKHLRRVIAFRQSILKKAFEGNLVHQSSDDESAQVLINRLKEERANYIVRQKIIEKNSPKKEFVMEKKEEIIDILKKSNKPISAKELWKKSIHENDIDAFYAELKKIQHDVIETKDGIESLLMLKNADK